MEESNVLVLEVLRQGENLAMSIFEENELAQTIRHYSQLSISEEQINRLCQETAAVLNKATKAGSFDPDAVAALRKAGQVLWDQLLSRPVKERLKGTAIRNLVLSLDERLINIPWELLYDGEAFLCLKFNLGRLVKTQQQLSLPRYRSLGGTPRMLILANPTEDLKSAYEEGVYIKNNFDRRRNQVSIDFKSTSIDTLYVKKNIRDYDIVHFAGHCEYQPDDPREAGWVLKDGRFSAPDIVSLGESAPLPSLIFSNACYSASACEGLKAQDYREKNYSLACAFLFSGVRHYIGTIWKIEDPHSLAFAREFYNQLLKGLSIGECLRLARLKLIKDYGNSILSWASYLLYGNPDFALFRGREKPKQALAKKKRLFSGKKLIYLSLAAVGVWLCGYLYFWLPTLNPSNYFLFLKSRDLFRQGKNNETILISSRIIRESPQFLSAYPLLADSYHKTGRRDEALKYYFEYARCSEREKDRRHLADAYLGIGWIYQLKGDYPRALDFYKKASAICEENDYMLGKATGLRRMAEWHNDNKEYSLALELLTRSAEINRSRQQIYEHRYNLACDYFDMGVVFSNKEDFATARGFYQKSCLLFKRMRLYNELSDCYFNIGETYAYEKEYQAAMDLYLRGLRLDREQNNKFNLASDYSMIGELYLEMDNFPEAEKSFLEAVRLSEEIKAQPELACAYYDLGVLYGKKGRKNKAKEYLRQAQEIYALIDQREYNRIKQELIGLSAD